MEDKRQWLIGRILHLSAQLSQQPDKDKRQQIQAALAIYTQALRDIQDPPQSPPYVS